MEILSSLSLAYGVYFLGTAGPGPANLAIIGTALHYGRTAAFTMALGVITGSITWGIVSALGLGAVLSAWPVLLNAMSLFGGLYLCWLAYSVLQKARGGTTGKVSSHNKLNTKGQQKHFLYGLGLHLTNPKAIFVWTSTIALGLDGSGGEGFMPLLIVVSCCMLGVMIFMTYAVVFSNPTITKAYLCAARTINLVVAALFAAAGLALLYRSAVLVLSI